MTLFWIHCYLIFIFSDEEITSEPNLESTANATGQVTECPNNEDAVASTSNPTEDGPDEVEMNTEGETCPLDASVMTLNSGIGNPEKPLEATPGSDPGKLHHSEVEEPDTTFGEAIMNSDAWVYGNETEAFVQSRLVQFL